MDLSPIHVAVFLIPHTWSLILLKPPDSTRNDLGQWSLPDDEDLDADDLMAEFNDLWYREKNDKTFEGRLPSEGIIDFQESDDLGDPSIQVPLTSDPDNFMSMGSPLELSSDFDDPAANQEADVLMASQMLASKRLSKRSASQIDAKVEVLVVVDNSIYRQYLLKSRNNVRVALARLRRYYAMVFAMVDQRYSTIPDSNLNIAIKISGILIAENRQDASWIEYQVKWTREHGGGTVDANRGLAKFQKWLTSQTSLPKHDHAMAFTRYKLVNKRNIGLGGMAYVNSICLENEQSISIVDDTGDFQCVKVVTHELGHSLGASHDGDKKNRDCPPNDNYVMAPQNSNERHKLKNAFFFSHCSIRQMKAVLGSPKGACVLDTPSVYYKYNLERRPPGQIYSPNLQCKMIFGKKSGFCKDKKLRRLMCGQLWCRDPVNGYTCRTNSYLTALPGTRCSKGKVCHLGTCQADPYSSNHVRRNKYQRQRATARMGGRRSNRRRYRGRSRQSAAGKSCSGDRNKNYCQGLIRLNPKACKRSAIGLYCCKTCARRRR